MVKNLQFHQVQVLGGYSSDFGFDNLGTDRRHSKTHGQIGRRKRQPSSTSAYGRSFGQGPHPSEVLRNSDTAPLYVGEKTGRGKKSY